VEKQALASDSVLLFTGLMSHLSDRRITELLSLKPTGKQTKNTKKKQEEEEKKKKKNKPVGDWISAPSPNLVAMTTRVGHTTFCMVSLNRPSPRTPWLAQTSPVYLPYKPTYRRFCANFGE